MLEIPIKPQPTGFGIRTLWVGVWLELFFVILTRNTFEAVGLEGGAEVITKGNGDKGTLVPITHSGIGEG